MTESKKTTTWDLDRHDRVRANTDQEINRDLDEAAAERVRYLATQPTIAVSDRLEVLEAEWDVERMLEANASTLSLVGISLATLTSRKWLLLPFVVAAFLLQHAVQGWCPPLVVFRRLGVRTRREIEAEKNALRIVRGDLVTAATLPAPSERAEAALRRVGLV